MTDIIRRLVGQLSPEPVGPPPLDARLVEDLGYHSLALAELAIAVADTFDLDLEDDATRGELSAVVTVRDLENLVHEATTRLGR